MKRRRVQFWGREILLGAGTGRRSNLGRSDPLSPAVCPSRGSREGRERRVPGCAEAGKSRVNKFIAQQSYIFSKALDALAMCFHI